MLKLAQVDVNVEIEQIFICAVSTTRFLANQKPNGSTYEINETNPDCVVVGEG